MGWIVVDAETGGIIDGALREVMPVVPDGQQAVQTALGYPDRCGWDPATRGFRDAAPARDPSALVPALQNEILALRERVDALETAAG